MFIILEGIVKLSHKYLNKGDNFGQELYENNNYNY